MTYDIFSSTMPAMPKPGKGTEIIKLLLSQVSKDMHEAIIPQAFPPLSARIAGVRLKFADNKYYELCGQMGHLIAPSGAGKNQLTHLVEAICRDFRQHDETEFRKLVEWQRLMKTKGANSEKPERPDVSFWFPPADMTNPAFLQNAMACEKLGARTMYVNMPEVEMADRLFGGHRQVSQMVRNIYDMGRAGALRATADGVTGNPTLRVNMNYSSTPEAARHFYKRDITNGFFGRIPFSYKKRGERKGRIPRQGQYSDEFLQALDNYLLRLDCCKGDFIVRPLNKLADQLAEEMARLADLADDDMLFELSHRSIFAAWKKAATLWILNDQTWTRSIGEWMVWFCYYDLWSKVQVFGDMFKGGDAPAEQIRKAGPRNMLSLLSTTFTESQLTALRQSLGKSEEGTKHQLGVWKNRNLITYDEAAGVYRKNEC